MIKSRSLTPIHILLGIQSLVVILVSINRLTSLTEGYVAANQFLRWVDLVNMIILPLISTVAFYLLIKQMEYDAPARGGRAHLALQLLFIVGVYLLAASYGDQEVTNYLHVRFCPDGDTSTLCQIIIFNDDEFSHWLFFTGFVMINVGVMLWQYLFPDQGIMKRADFIWLIVNALFIGLGIFANLAFEVIGLDLYIVALLALLSWGLLWRQGKRPLYVYYATAYGLGLVATFLYKAL